MSIRRGSRGLEPASAVCVATRRLVSLAVVVCTLGIDPIGAQAQSERPAISSHERPRIGVGIEAGYGRFIGGQGDPYIGSDTTAYFGDQSSRAFIDGGLHLGASLFYRRSWWDLHAAFELQNFVESGARPEQSTSGLATAESRRLGFRIGPLFHLARLPAANDTLLVLGPYAGYAHYRATIAGSLSRDGFDPGDFGALTIDVVTLGARFAVEVPVALGFSLSAFINAEAGFGWAHGSNDIVDGNDADGADLDAPSGVDVAIIFGVSVNYSLAL